MSISTIFEAPPTVTQHMPHNLLYINLIFHRNLIPSQVPVSFSPSMMLMISTTILKWFPQSLERNPFFCHQHRQFRLPLNILPRLTPATNHIPSKAKGLKNNIQHVFQTYSPCVSLHTLCVLHHAYPLFSDPNNFGRFYYKMLINNNIYLPVLSLAQSLLCPLQVQRSKPGQWETCLRWKA